MSNGNNNGGRSGGGYGDGSPSSPGGGFSSPNGTPASQTPAGTQVRTPDGRTGTSDGYGGVHTPRR
jgi:hypothetical protein